MEHIDRALQKVRRYDYNGNMELPSAVQFGFELGMASKTIQRLIQKMRDLHGMPIVFNASRAGYQYTEDVAFSPFLQLSESELVSLYLAQQVGVFQNTKFHAGLKSSFGKVLGLCGKTLSFDPALLDECFSLSEDGPRARFSPVHLDVCTRAALRQKELVLTYVKQHGEGAGKPELRRVRPLHITYRDFAYYVLCKDLNRTRPRLFMVTRMQEVEETEVQFKRPKGFNARAYLDKAFKVFASKEGVKVVLQFTANAAPRVVERRWHSTQKFSPVAADGSVQMTMQVGLAPDLYNWIGGFFGDCRVLEPTELRGKMRELHLQGAGQY